MVRQTWNQPDRPKVSDEGKSGMKVVLELPDVTAETYEALRQAQAEGILHLAWHRDEDGFGLPAAIRVLDLVDLTGPMESLDDVMDIAVERQISEHLERYTTEILPNGEEFQVGADTFHFVETPPAAIHASPESMVIQRKDDGQYFEVMPDFSTQHLYAHSPKEG
jgi:hypothetical protein